MKQRICVRCGVVFSGGPNANYCLDCRPIRTIERYLSNKESHPQSDHAIGNTAKCLNCGSDYTVINGNQKYCTACRAIGAQRIAYERKHPKKEIILNCALCGKEFVSIKGKKTCSPECSKEKIYRNRVNALFRSGKRKNTIYHPPESHQSPYGVVGVYFSKRQNRWVLKLKSKQYGAFHTFEEAVEAKKKHLAAQKSGIVE